MYETQVKIRNKVSYCSHGTSKTSKAKPSQRNDTGVFLIPFAKTCLDQTLKLIAAFSVYYELSKSIKYHLNLIAFSLHGIKSSKMR